MSRSAMSSWRARSGDPVDQRLRRFIRVFVKLQLGDPNLTYGSRQLRDGLPDKRTEVEAIQETTPATADRDPSRWPRAGCVSFTDLASTTMALMTMSMCEHASRGTGQVVDCRSTRWPIST